jgi:F0F1-type ATP synthase assembly protein I
VDPSQRRELSTQINRTTGSYELVLSPLVLALGAYFLDRWLGTTPILTILAAVIGLTGAVVKIYYGYAHEMDQHDAAGPWGRRPEGAPND